MTAPSEVFHPGEIVPVSGIYGCGEDADGHRYESADVKGSRFPPMPVGCKSKGWVLDRSVSHAHHLRRSDVEDDYAAALEDWDRSGERKAWETTASDGLASEVRP